MAQFLEQHDTLATSEFPQHPQNDILHDNPQTKAWISGYTAAEKTDVLTVIGLPDQTPTGYRKLNLTLYLFIILLVMFCLCQWYLKMISYDSQLTEVERRINKMRGSLNEAANSL